MTRPNPAGTVTDEDTGERWYIIPDGNGGEYRLLSVTTAFNVISKMGLNIWMTEFTATAAFEELPTVVTSSRKKPCGRTRHKCKNHDWSTCTEKGCGTCRECVAVWISKRHEAHSRRRADEGARVHDVIEWWSLHGEIREHDKDIAPYVEAFRAFTVEYGLVPESFLFCEARCLHLDDKFAGTTDGALRIDAWASPAAAKLVARVLRAAGEYDHLKTSAAIQKAVVRDRRSVVVLIDWKTREKPEAQFYPEYALQLTGYRRSQLLRIKGTEQDIPMPTVDAAMIVQLRPDGATPRLAVTDDDTYDAFLCALRLYLWRAEKGNRAVGTNSFPLGRKDAEPDDNDAACEVPDPFALVGAAAGSISDDHIPF